jgi:signal transduction histidine kinase
MEWGHRRPAAPLVTGIGESGLALIIASSLVELHGNTISVESSQVAESFTTAFPVGSSPTMLWIIRMT